MGHAAIISAGEWITSSGDVMLMQALMKATPDSSAPLIVGDIDNCPPSDAGRNWPDIIDSGACPWCA